MEYKGTEINSETMHVMRMKSEMPFLNLQKKLLDSGLAKRIFFENRVFYLKARVIFILIAAPLKPGNSFHTGLRFVAYKA